MGCLGYLNEKEGRDFIHLVQNNRRLDKLSELHSGKVERDLAKQVENEKFNMKNKYRLDW